jgi:hypothetical protein
MSLATPAGLAELQAMAEKTTAAIVKILIAFIFITFICAVWLYLANIAKNIDFLSLM